MRLPLSMRSSTFAPLAGQLVMPASCWCEKGVNRRRGRRRSGDGWESRGPLGLVGDRAPRLRRLGCRAVIERLRLEPIADPEVGVDVLPARRVSVQLRAAACERRRRPSGRRGPSRSPRRAGRSPRARSPARSPRRAPARARTRAGSARGCARRRRPGTGPARISTSPATSGPASALRAAAPAAAHDRLDPRHHLLGVRRLDDPVVGTEPQAADALGDGRALGADDDPEVGEHPADSLEELPARRPEDREVDQERVQLHRHQLGLPERRRRGRGTPSRPRRSVG